MMGNFVSQNLHYRGYSVSIADKKHGITYVNKGIQHIHCDFENYDHLPDTHYDLVINCVPSKFGFKMTQTMVELGMSVVDLSFSLEDPFKLDRLAKKNNCLVVPDAGLAPGLTNLFTGRELAKSGQLERVSLNVGGVSTSPFEPYGYAVTWSVEDLQEEYLRPARAISGHEIFTGSPFNNITDIDVRGVSMVRFLSDGLRTLLRYKDHIDTMDENTIRWNYKHMWAAQKLIEDGSFVEEIKAKCSNIPDTVVFKAEFYKDYNKSPKVVTMIDYSRGSESAMSRTTALTCATVADLILSGIYNKIKGVRPLEEIGKDSLSFDFILDSLGHYGIHFEYE